MKESDYKKGLVKHLVEKDQHLALNIEQAEQLVEYIREYEDGVGMLPPLIADVKYTPQYEGDEDTWVGGQDGYTIVSMLQWEGE